MIDDKHAPTEIRPRIPLPPAPARGPVQPSPLSQPGTHLQYLPGTALVPAPAHLPELRQPRTTRRPRATSHRAKAQWWERWPTAYGLGWASGAVAMFAFFLIMRLVSS